METALQAIFHHLQTLRAFQSAHAVPEGLCRVQAVCPESKSIPAVTFYGEDEESREFALSTFGTDGWRKSDSSGIWQNVVKTVDGVRVFLYRAYMNETFAGETCEVPPHLLTGLEAGIDLPAGSVREVEVVP